MKERERGGKKREKEMEGERNTREGKRGKRKQREKQWIWNQVFKLSLTILSFECERGFALLLTLPITVHGLLRKIIR